ncbi:MAG: alpha/beta fold hydrolase [Alphaproteobacteria bacterium]|nr:alpha/beta fold hydrolase [Alphaproteobacteria bacterium]
MPLDLPAGVRARRVKTARLDTHLLEAGPEGAEVVVFVHGNVSSSRFYAETLAALPARYRGVAVDLRGYGHSESAPVDATRGVRDFSDDVVALLDALGVARAHLVGWSVGGGVVQQVAIDHPGRVVSLTLESPMSPFGFGGTKGLDGAPCWPDHAGTGGGTANPDFVARLARGDASEEADTSPRKIFRAFYVKPPFSPGARLEDLFVQAMLTTLTGDDHYPGDMVPSPNWPGVAPGTRGMNNAISGRHCDLSAFAGVDPRPPVLWIRGADDQIVSDHSLFDFGFLGQLGAVPGWPGAEVFPPQPMVGQIRAVLERYGANGGAWREEVLPDCGHSPHLEAPARFLALLLAHLEAAAG